MSRDANAEFWLQRKLATLLSADPRRTPDTLIHLHQAEAGAARAPGLT
jgi:hypothetical protein